MQEATPLSLFPTVEPRQEYVPEKELLRRLGVSRTTLWRLRQVGLPHIWIGRRVRYDVDQVERWLTQNPERLTDEEDASTSPNPKPAAKNLWSKNIEDLPPCHWKTDVALDPKHRPQTPFRPSSTVRREWWRYPQEAHLLDPVEGKYRRLRASEIAVIQSFPIEWADNTQVDELNKIRGYGDAVPPMQAEVLFRCLQEVTNLPLTRAIEICAGFGGLALGATKGLSLQHLALVEKWSVACQVLRNTGIWNADEIFEEDVMNFNWERYKGNVDILSGGPPCQPWSLAGKGLGAEDERDLLGYTPELVEQLLPRIFLFENVPGLLTGENEVYADRLIRKLRDAGGKNAYAVCAAIFNAADFGVPQTRRRVFIVGIRGATVSTVHRYFDLVSSRRTHGDPKYLLPDKLKPWRTLDEALPDWHSQQHSWRRWISLSKTYEDQTGAMNHGEELRPAAFEGSPTKIQLQWPHRGFLPRWSEEGWVISDGQALSQTGASEVPLIRHASSCESDPLHDPWLITGDPVIALESLQRTHGRRIDLVYIDTPRIKTNAATFDAADSQAALDTWLTVAHSLLIRGIRLLSDEGALVALCGINELPYIQILLNEINGPQNHVGTISWQKGYSPRNMPNMRDISPTHDNLIVFARRKERLPPVALRIPADGFQNADGDPRGPWNAEQKGANKPDCDYEVNLPPYRWNIVEGELPPGVWRINPKSGVIWGKKEDLKTAGTWHFSVEVSDKNGARARKRLSITVHENSEKPPLATIPWLIAKRDGNGKINNGPDSSGALRIVTKRMPIAAIGEEYSACLIAAGGSPWVGTTRPGKTSSSGKGRYWEFPPSTLLQYAARDAVDFKKKDDAIPALKNHLGTDKDKPLNQMSTWLGRAKGDHTKPDNDPFGVGYSHDAKEELERLKEAKVISAIVGTSKPMRLMMRLLALFARPSSFIVDIGSPAAEMAAAAVAAGRRAVYVEFPSSASTRESLTLPRLKCASRGEHPVPSGIIFDTATPQLEGEVSDSVRGFRIGGAPRQPSPNAQVCHFVLGPPAISIDRQLGTVAFKYDVYPTREHRFLEALASVEGLAPVAKFQDGVFATSLDGNIRAIYVPSANFLDSGSIQQCEAIHKRFLDAGGRLRIYYHRGQAIGTSSLESALEFRRIPFDLRVMAKLL